MKLTLLSLLTILFCSCENINLDSLNKQDDFTYNYPDLVTNLNYTNYPINGSCTDDVSKIFVKINGSDNSANCVSNSWEMFLDLSSQPNGDMDVIISYEKNSIKSKFDQIIINKNINLAPVVSQSCATSVNEDSSYTCTFNATDADVSDIQTFSFDASNTCSFVSVNSSTGVVSGTPTNSNVGTCTLAVKSNDGFVNSNVEAISLTIINMNDAPVLSQSCNTSVNEDSPYSCTPSVSDVDAGSSQTFSLDATNTCSFASIDSSTGVISGTPTNSSVGSCTLAFKSNDGSVDSNIESINLTVTNTNDAPVLSQSCATSVNEDSGYNCSPSVVDVDSGSTQSYAFDATNTCNFLSINSSTGVISGTADNSNVGTCTLAFKSNDGMSDSNIESFSLTVVNTNDAPVLSQACSTSTFLGNSYSCTPSVLDPDVGSSQTYSFHSNSCSFLSINSSTGEVSGTAQVSDIGACRFELQSNDGLVNSNIEVVNLVVPSSMVTTWRIGDPAYGDGDKSLTLPLRGGYNYNFSVDWGDGQSSVVTSFDDPDATHIYANSGDYTVSISGLAETWYFNNSGDKEKIIEVNDLGDTGWTNLRSAFFGCSNLVAFSGGQTSNVVSMQRMFSNTSSLTALNISTFDTSNVTSMFSMFQKASSLTAINLSTFNTSNVTSMANMFYDASALTSLNLSTFDTSSVTSMKGMFDRTSSITSLNVSSFNTSNVVDMRDMFQWSSSLTSLDLSSFDTANVTNMRQMFNNAFNLSSLDLTGWDISHNPDISLAISGTSSGLVISCDQDGSPGTGSIFGKPCN